MARSLKRTAPSALRYLWQPFHRFAQLESASSILLVICTAVALIWANSHWAEAYRHFKELPLGLTFGDFRFMAPLEMWVNDGLMAVFFLVVGLEIKREMLGGELASLKQSALPIAGALGGMVFPAVIFSLLNHGGPAADGWGIPMATDIAFALGVLLLLGKRIPIGLKVFLVALAIIDDIGAILVIAVFYTSHLHVPFLLLALAILCALVLLNKIGARHPFPYLALGAMLWIAMLNSGVHATLSGVLLAFCIPHRSKLSEEEFPDHASGILERFLRTNRNQAVPVLSDARVTAIRDMEQACQAVEPLLQRMEAKLHPFVSYGILPLFALVNAGLSFSAGTLGELVEPVGLGVLLGLGLGKPLGITLFSWLAIRMGIGAMPGETNWRQMIGAGILGGIGFTMAIFIAGLGLPSPELLDGAKLAVLTVSICAGVAGYFFLFFSSQSNRGAPKTS